VSSSQGFATSHLAAETGPFAAFSLAQYPLQARVDVLNTMLAHKKLVVFTKKDGSTLFKLAAASDAK
jgi:hypothetical protein